jgi:hypothetical protein
MRWLAFTELTMTSAIRFVFSSSTLRWADVTERGYGVLELTPDAANLRWWFVHPYATDPAAGAVTAAAFRTEHATWPPALEPFDRELVEPTRPGLPADLPPRPDDLVRLRVRRWFRLTAEASAWATVIVLPVAALVAGVRRWRQHHGR